MAEITMEPLLETMRAMLEELRRQNKRDDDLWDADDIAHYMKLEKSTVQQRILRKPNFPRPVLLQTSLDGGGGGKRWVPKEVKQWTMKHKQS